ncbi:endonuclease domain-containing protein [Maribacter algicola]|uniref:Endonuclease domain-containing protein n=1 Tax=Meishania litoralis TaxID=3434685 RepID=A0ACC7LK39_9FLAO
MGKNKNLLKEEGMHAGASADKFAFAAFLRKVETPQEKKLWNFLCKRPKDLKFRRQHPFGKYVLDFYCHRARLVIELDGGQHKFNIEYDKDRTRVIEDHGLKVVRFENFEIDNNFEGVIKKIEAFLG